MKSPANGKFSIPRRRQQPRAGLRRMNVGARRIARYPETGVLRMKARPEMKRILLSYWSFRVERSGEPNLEIPGRRFAHPSNYARIELASSAAWSRFTGGCHRLRKRRSYAVTIGITRYIGNTVLMPPLSRGMPLIIRRETTLRADSSSTALKLLPRAENSLPPPHCDSAPPQHLRTSGLIVRQAGVRFRFSSTAKCCRSNFRWR